MHLEVEEDGRLGDDGPVLGDWEVVHPGRRGRGHQRDLQTMINEGQILSSDATGQRPLAPRSRPGACMLQ